MPSAVLCGLHVNMRPAWYPLREPAFCAIGPSDLAACKAVHRKPCEGMRLQSALQLKPATTVLSPLVRPAGAARRVMFGRA